MKYFLHAVETETGRPFEQEVYGRFEQLKDKLAAQGYSDFHLEERWESLEEMNQSLEEMNQSVNNLEQDFDHLSA